MEKRNGKGLGHKKKRILIPIIIGAVIIILIACFLDVFSQEEPKQYLSKSDFYCREIIDDDTEIQKIQIKDCSKADYKDLINECKVVTKRLSLFPESIDESLSCECLYYLKRTYADFGPDWRAELFFCVKYPAEQFEFEIERLANVKIINSSKETEMKPIITDEYFSLKSYVAIYNEDSRFEYCLLDYEKQTIIYIYLFDSGDGVYTIPQEYIPTKNSEPYSIYK